ncbi:MAG: MazG nucleotide pyrophosphohydrolase domain-containing protein [Candidatus Hodarchaeota archaeon]
MRISEFQQMIKNVYLDRDSKRGIKGTFIWLVEEIGELARIIKKLKINKKKASEEIADIFAWLNSIANLLEINIETSLFKKYPNKCIRCNSVPCECE